MFIRKNTNFEYSSKKQFMAGHGGARIGAGRKPIPDELNVRKLAIQAIEETYGSVTEGLKFLLASGEPALIKFAWGHAIGNPKDNIEIDMNSVIEQVQIIQLPDNGRDGELIYK